MSCARYSMSAYTRRLTTRRSRPPPTTIVISRRLRAGREYVSSSVRPSTSETLAEGLMFPPRLRGNAPTFPASMLRDAVGRILPRVAVIVDDHDGRLTLHDDDVILRLEKFLDRLAASAGRNVRRRTGPFSDQFPGTGQVRRTPKRGDRHHEEIKRPRCHHGHVTFDARNVAGV